MGKKLTEQLVTRSAIADFEAYLDEPSYIGHDGKPVKRRYDWAISRIHHARQVWVDSRLFAFHQESTKS